MEKRAIIATCLMAIFILMIGCAASNNASTAKTPAQTSEAKPIPYNPTTSEKDVESALLKQVEAGSVVAVYESEMKIKAGETKENWLIIKNSKDAGDTFSITACTGCEFENDFVDISMNKYAILKFKASTAGQNEIKIKDSRDNAYGSATFNVATE